MAEVTCNLIAAGTVFGNQVTYLITQMGYLPHHAFAMYFST